MLTNMKNGKIYIGKTEQTPARKRWLQHIRDSRNPKYYISRSINTHGSESFSFEVIAEYKNSKDLNSGEIELIALYKSTDPKIGYNLLIGGNGGAVFGRKQSEETKRKISEANKGKNLGKIPTEETLQKMREARKLRLPPTEATKLKISKSNKGKIIPKEAIEKIRKANKGKKRTPEQIEQMKIRRTGQKASDEAKANMSAAQKIASPARNFKHSEESKLKISKANSGSNNYWSNHPLPQKTLDALSKNRKPKQQYFPTEESLLELRKMHEEGYNKTELAKKLNVSVDTIRRALNGTGSYKK